MTRVFLLMALISATVLAAGLTAASLPEPNYIDLRVSAVYLVTLPDGRRVTVDNVSLGRAVVNEMMAAQQPKPAPVAEPEASE